MLLAGGPRPGFSDEIPVWAWGYVNQAVAMGLARGYPDGTFRAEQPVTGHEALAVLVRVLGPAGEAWAVSQPWPQGYVAAAGALGLLADAPELIEPARQATWLGQSINRGEMAVVTRAAVWTALRLDASGATVQGPSLAARDGWWLARPLRWPRRPMAAAGC